MWVPQAAHDSLTHPVVGGGTWTQSLGGGGVPWPPQAQGTNSLPCTRGFCRGTRMCRCVCVLLCAEQYHGEYEDKDNRRKGGQKNRHSTRQTLEWDRTNSNTDQEYSVLRTSSRSSITDQTTDTWTLGVESRREWPPILGHPTGVKGAGPDLDLASHQLTD